MVLDVNAELFPSASGDKIALMLASSLTDERDDGSYNPDAGPSLADNYDYVMHGRVYSIKHIENQCVEVQGSFGGLLMRLRGEQAQVEGFYMDMTFFILLRKGAGASSSSAVEM